MEKLGQRDEVTVSMSGRQMLEDDVSGAFYVRHFDMLFLIFSVNIAHDLSMSVDGSVCFVR